MPYSREQDRHAVFRNGKVELTEPVDWPEGTELLVSPSPAPLKISHLNGHALISGFGLSGRCVADLLDDAGVSYTVIERNNATVATQRALGRNIIGGDTTDAATLLAAGLHRASLIALTIPDEDAVIRAVELARKLRPEIYIIARTLHASKGMKAAQLGANKVIKAEQAVAVQFYEFLCDHLGKKRDADNG